MIYDFPTVDCLFRQGDIFTGLPRVEISLRRIPVVTATGEQVETPWEEIIRDGNPITAILAVNPVSAIIISQDCDASRAPDITLCEIRHFREVKPKSETATKVKAWVKLITQQARLNQKWLYLPPDPQIGFTDRMGVDFHISLRLPRQDLEEMRSLRKGRLNEVACSHFRERIAEFFRRYPYNEWYPLTSEEMTEYQRDYPDAEPYPWQTDPSLR